MSKSHELVPMTLKIGIALVILAGLKSVVLGVIFYTDFWISEEHPGQAYVAGELKAPADFTLDEIKQQEPWGAELLSTFLLSAQLAYSYVLVMGIALITLAVIGLRRRMKWVWILLMVILVWTGANNAEMLYAQGDPITPALAELIGVVGLFICRGAIFGKKEAGTPSPA